MHIYAHSAENQVELANFKPSDFLFKNAIVNSGYKYYQKQSETTRFLIVEA